MVAVVVALVLVVGSAAVWWLTRDGDDAPFADRPRVTDDRAGLSYAIPEGWKQAGKGDLIDAFTSSVTKKGAGDEDGGVVLAGQAGAIAKSGLKSEAERAARSNAEYFFPDGSSQVSESRATTVEDRPAHSVVLKVKDGEGGTNHLRLTVVSVTDNRSGFLLAVAQPDGTDVREDVDAILESASLA